jgi:hypothetical protein
MVGSLLTDGDNLSIPVKVEKLDPTFWGLDVTLVIFYCKCNLYRGLVETSDGKRSLGRPRRRWEDIIKMDFQEVGCGGMDWMELVQNRDK